MTKNKPSVIDPDLLRDLFFYDSETGHFTLLENGKRVGSVGQNGYEVFWFDKKLRKVHRMAWVYMTGEQPNIIDHINRVKSDNRFKNLRSVSATQNAWNASKAAKNSGKYVGVTRNSKSSVKPWNARIICNGKENYLGAFKCQTGAYIAYLQAKMKMHSMSNRSI